MIDQSLDSLILERLKRSAAGLSWSDGRPVSELDRLLAQGALIGRVAKPRGGMSLFALVSALHSAALLDVTLSKTLGGLLSTAEASHFSAVMADIVSGRLIVREPLNFLRCNDVPEIQSLSSAREDLASMAILVRFVVKISEAREWLEVHHGVEIPDWLAPSLRLGDGGGDRQGESETSEPPPKWSDSLPSSKLKLRLQFDAIEFAISAKGYPRQAIPEGGKGGLKLICIAQYPERFPAETSFENAWKELNRLDLVHVHDYKDRCGNPDGRQ